MSYPQTIDDHYDLCEDEENAEYYIQCFPDQQCSQSFKTPQDALRILRSSPSKLEWS